MQIFMSFTLVKVAQQPLLGSYKVATEKGKENEKLKALEKKKEENFNIGLETS